MVTLQRYDQEIQVPKINSRMFDNKFETELHILHGNEEENLRRWEICVKEVFRGRDINEAFSNKEVSKKTS